MPEEFYTMGIWRVREGSEEEFIEAWRAVGTAFASVPDAPKIKGTLVQSLSDPNLYISFGAWPSLERIEAMREDPGSQKAIERAASLCTEATPGAYRVVTEVETGPNADNDA